MREKTMKKGHLLLTLLAFVCLMGLGTIHANAATVKAKVDVKKFYGIAEQVLQEINRQRRNNGLSDLKMDANFTEVAMDIALQKQGGDLLKVLHPVADVELRSPLAGLIRPLARRL